MRGNILIRQLNYLLENNNNVNDNDNGNNNNNS